MNTSPLQSQDGFTIVQAVFILIVLSLLGVAMMRLIGVQSYTSAFALQGTRAYQAARSGLEWGAARADSGASCNGTLTINDFTVNVSCSSLPFREGSIGPYDVYQVNATATFGAYGSPDYISRRAQIMVAFP